MILLDTDICIELLKGNHGVVERNRNTQEDLTISFITVGELFYGAEKSSNKEKNRVLVEEFLLSISVIHSTNRIMKTFGELKAVLVRTGDGLPDADILIAATSLNYCRMLITGNTKHFNRFSDLTIENWIR